MVHGLLLMVWLLNCIQLIELAPIEDAKKSSDIKASIANRTTQNQMLPEEKAQAVHLATVICPIYDPSNKFWVAVNKLTSKINSAKQEVSELTQFAEGEIRNKCKSTSVASNLLSLLTTKGLKSIKMVTRKQTNTLHHLIKYLNHLILHP